MLFALYVEIPDGEGVNLEQVAEQVMSRKIVDLYQVSAIPSPLEFAKVFSEPADDMTRAAKE